MKTRTFVTQMAVLSSFLVGAALQTIAQPRLGDPGGPRGSVRFELTADQRVKVRDARKASENDRAELLRKLAVAQKEAVAAALAENPDENAVRSKLEVITKLQTELGLLNLRSFKDVKFTDEQKEKLTGRPPLGYMVLFGGPGGMGVPFGFGAGGGGEPAPGGPAGVSK